MHRYHFNVFDGHPILDHDGIELSGVTAARVHALAIGSELERSLVPLDMNRVQFVFVHGYNGRLLFTLTTSTSVHPLARKIALAEMRVARQEVVVARLERLRADTAPLAWNVLSLLRDGLAKLVGGYQVEVRRRATYPVPLKIFLPNVGVEGLKWPADVDIRPASSSDLTPRLGG